MFIFIQILVIVFVSLTVTTLLHYMGLRKLHKWIEEKTSRSKKVIPMHFYIQKTLDNEAKIKWMAAVGSVWGLLFTAFAAVFLFYMKDKLNLRMDELAKEKQTQMVEYVDSTISAISPEKIQNKIVEAYSNLKEIESIKGKAADDSKEVDKILKDIKKRKNVWSKDLERKVETISQELFENNYLSDLEKVKNDLDREIDMLKEDYTKSVSMFLDFENIKYYYLLIRSNNKEWREKIKSKLQENSSLFIYKEQNYILIPIDLSKDNHIQEIMDKIKGCRDTLNLFCSIDCFTNRRKPDHILKNVKEKPDIIAKMIPPNSQESIAVMYKHSTIIYFGRGFTHWLRWYCYNHHDNKWYVTWSPTE